MASERLERPYILAGKKIWVAGHRGMVGSALLRRLAREDCRILTESREDLDLRDQQAVRGWMVAQKPEVVIIAAARVGGIMANATYPADFFYDNIMINTNILHSAYEVGVERALVLGSSCIYPRDCAQPIMEDMLLGGALETTNEAYAIAKIAGLKMAQYYRAQYGCDFISAMPCNLYGVGDSYDVNDSHVIPALIMKAHAAKVEGRESLEVWGSGAALREFMDVDDLADALIYILQCYCGKSHINVGSGQEITIKNLVKIVCDIVGFDGEIKFNLSKPDGTPRKVMDNSCLHALGWRSEMCSNDDCNMFKIIKSGIIKCYADFLGRVIKDGGTA